MKPIEKPANNPLAHLNLGQATTYPSVYQPDLLQAVPRHLNRQPIGIDDQKLPFHGVDFWTGYELSWLNARGLPQVAMAEFIVPVGSANLVESKSFKLYLNSFNEHQFNDWQQVQELLVRDLSECAKAPVKVHLLKLDEVAAQPFTQWSGTCIDEQDIDINHYDYDPELLTSGSAKNVSQNTEQVSETLYSHLLKSNCLITNQPDWGSVMIRYRGPRIDRAALLRYLVSFRRHNEFHEQCVERIFVDLQHQLKLQQLTVYARYTRRGGLDINPFRSNFEQPPARQRLPRQ